MPIQPMTFQPLTFEQNNPYLAGMKYGQSIIGSQLQNQGTSLANQAAQAQLPYVGQSAQAALLAQQLTNQSSQLKMPYIAPTAAADLAYKQAQTPFIRAQTGLTSAQIPLTQAEAAKARMYINNPMLSMGGTAGQLGAYLYLQQQGNLGKQQPTNAQPVAGQPQQQAYQMPAYMVPGSNAAAPDIQPGQPAQMQQGQATQMQMPPQQGMPGQAPASMQEQADLLMNSLTASMRKNVSQADYMAKKTSGYQYLSMPVDQRDAVLAQAAGMGYDPTEASKQLIEGKSLKDLAEAKGFDFNNMPTPVYPTTKNALAQIQKRQQAVTEINTLNPILTDAIAPYAQTFKGYSPRQIADAMNGDDPEKQAKYLAAKAVMPEMSALRTKAMGGDVGVEAIKLIQDASMGHIQSFNSLVKPEVYKRANELVDHWIEQAATSANTVGLKTYGKDPQVQQLADSMQTTAQPKTSAPAGTTRVLNGQTYIKNGDQWELQ